MAKKIMKSQILRHFIQLILFILLPGLYAMTFSELKTVYQMIIGGNFNFIEAFPSLIELTAVMLLTIVMGRWFCGWLCAFGAYNDLVYGISKKLFKTKFRIDAKTDEVLKYAKYVVLLFIIIISWTMGSNILQNVSPWDAFGQITDPATVLTNLLIGLVLLILITIGAAFIERFFCRYLCPLGAVFSIISKIGIVKINKPKAECGKCKACTINCSMGLNLYKVNGYKGGDCINCLKCTEVCPRNNANVNILGKDLDQNLAGAVAMTTMLGVYGLTNFGADAISRSNMAANSTSISSEAAVSNTGSDSAVQYKDGTYEGSGIGFKGRTTKVSVTIADGKISNVEIVSYGDDRKWFEKAKESVIDGILLKQSTDIDTVSGATYSSKGIISAVKDALSQAAVSEAEKNSADNRSQSTEQTDASAAKTNTSSTQSNNSSSKINSTTASTNQESISTTSNTKSTGAYKDGTYEGSGTGFKGRTTKVSVTVANGKISNIETVSYGDDRKWFERASSTIIPKIISNQSTSVDTVSGATYSSKGIMSAVADALSQAK